MSINYFITPFTAFILTLILMPFLRRVAFRMNLTDQPGGRKVHRKPVPLVGGIAVFGASMLVFLLNGAWDYIQMPAVQVTAAGAGVLLLTGVIDDLMDVRASFKLAIQIAVAFFVFQSGIRIESLHGLLGIYEIPYFWQGILTILVITGVINAFNLVDGIDGLSASMAILALSAFAVLIIISGNMVFLPGLLGLIGTLLGFLHYNLDTRQKVFMGDAGALFLGLVIVCAGISLIQSAQYTSMESVTVATVVGVMALPVIDSLRVYRSRIKRGYSPFRADKTHFHHLVLMLGVKHKTATAFIVLVAIGLLALTVASGSVWSITVALVLMLVFFGSISSVLSLNNEVIVWREKLLSQEQSVLAL